MSDSRASETFDLEMENQRGERSGEAGKASREGHLAEKSRISLVTVYSSGSLDMLDM